MVLATGFSAWAALAGSRAAKAARSQVATLINAERPFLYLKIDEPGIELLEDGQLEIERSRIRYRICNAGKTPAFLYEVCEKFEVLDGSEPVVALNPYEDRGRLLPIGTVVNASEPYKVAANLIKEGKGFEMLTVWPAFTGKRVLFKGFVRYDDAFGRHYIYGFQASFSPPHRAWAFRGGEEHNYSREETVDEIPPHPRYSSQIRAA
ncbi:MAG: hypothetical protein ACT6XY_03835 [Phreatobacter sp.]|uniref:hypothetical protein n=1 Tax=Phreatobacter sp. TaxID=1966341 RepID=UPI004036DA3B